MKFERALEQFLTELATEYGVAAFEGESVVKIGISPALYDRVMCDLFERGKREIRFSSISDTQICGVKIVPLRKSDF